MRSASIDNNPKITNLDEALERIRQMESAFGIAWHSPRILGLTASESEFLGVILHKHGVADYEGIYTLMYGVAEDPPEPKILNVMACKIRKKLGLHDIHLDTVWGRGMSMQMADKWKLQALYDEHDDPRVGPELARVLVMHPQQQAA